MNVADKTPAAGCELQPHADVGPLYQLQWANSGLKPTVTLLTALKIHGTESLHLYKNAVFTRGNCSWTVL